MYYDKRIRYLSYYESGIKLQNAGYVKFQVRDSLCQMVIYVKGPRLMGSGEAKVYLLSEKPEKKDENSFYSENRNNLNRHLLGTLSIRNGQGYCAVRLHAENMADSGMRYDEICGIRIELHEYQYLESQWHVVNFMPGQRKRQKENAESGQNRQQDSRMAYVQGERNNENSVAADSRQGMRGGSAEDEQIEVNLIVTPVSEGLRVEKTTTEEFMPDFEEMADFRADKREDGTFLKEENAAENPGRMEKTAAEAVEQGAEETVADEEESMQEMLEREILREEAKAQPFQPEQTLEEEIRLSEKELQSDKWEQLKQTYPIVHPIREDEEYLKITPKDFVIFTEKYQELVHNSFLLHGYYNYKHLILGRKEKEGKAAYYLGVPGTFHEREKTVAVMFGFEAFDGKREPAENGDFGYYLRKVEI